MPFLRIWLALAPKSATPLPSLVPVRFTSTEVVCGIVSPIPITRRAISKIESVLAWKDRVCRRSVRPEPKALSRRTQAHAGAGDWCSRPERYCCGRRCERRVWAEPVSALEQWRAPRAVHGSGQIVADLTAAPAASAEGRRSTTYPDTRIPLACDNHT